jgi:hypothetical protein
MDILQRERFLGRQYCELPWGKVRLRAVKKHDRYVSGGELWYTGGRILDVRSFFMQSLDKTYELYGKSDLPTIMNQARDELTGAGLWAAQNNWYRPSALSDYVLHLPEFATLDIPSLEVPHEFPGISQQCIGSVACGFIPGPVYEYDLVSAFASGLLEVPELREYVTLLHNYRTRLKGLPSARIVKIMQSVLPGKLISDRVDPRWRNRGLGLYTRAVTRYKLTQAMMQAVDKGGTVFRWYIDGFFTDVPIMPEDGLTGELGSWKETIHDGGMLMADTSVFRLYGAEGQVNKERSNGYTDLDWDAIRDNPLNIRVTRTTTDWDNFTDKKQKVRLLFENGHHQCEYCHQGFHLTREGYDQYFN